MVRLSIVTSLLAAASSVSAVSSKANLKPSKERVPGAFIFELEDGQDVAEFASSVKDQGHTRMNLEYKLFKGVSVQLDDVENAEARALEIAAKPAVKRVWPVEMYSIPQDEVQWVGAPSRGSSVLSKRANDSVTTFAPHVMTQVDKLRAKGVTGKGVKIAVLDTGIDYNHPALGGCFGEGCLVSFGTDLVGDDYTGSNVPVPDDDPMDCDGHGTHVAGAIAAQPNDYGFTGAAPDVTLGIYKVFGCAGSASNDVLIAAYNQAFEAGADIITASIGGASGWTEDPWAVAVSRIVDQGVPCTVSAGNSGDAGLFFASTAANGKGVTAIASFDNTQSPILLYLSEFSVDGGEAQEFGYTPATPAFTTSFSLPLWAPDLDPTVPDGGCDPYPEGTPDLSEYIVLVRRGSCLFTEKAQNAAAFGAKYLIIYNNAAGTANFDVSGTGIEGAAMVTADVGEGWIELLAAGSEVLLDVVEPESAETDIVFAPNAVTGGALSTFTSWGPTYGVDAKPQFGSPGGNILSTYPLALGEYAVLSGTSMACPLVAAVYALIYEVRGSFDPVLIENLLSANANPQLFNDGASFYNFLAPVPQQGGGLIQAYDAAYATTLLEPSGLSFNDTANLVEVLNFTISNIGDEEVTYEISHVPTISMYTLEPESFYPAYFPNEPVDASATLEFSEGKITVPAGDSVTVEVMPTPPEGLDTRRLPVWSGFIAVNGSDGTSLSLPYQGVAGSLYEATVLGSEDSWISRSDRDDLTPSPGNTTFTLPAPGSSGNGTYVLPRLVAYLALGSAELRAGVVALTTCPPDWVTEDPWGVDTIGQPEGSPLYYLPRTGNYIDWAGKLDNGKYAPAGKYKFVVRALRITGDPENLDDWDVAESFTFRIKYDE